MIIQKLHKACYIYLSKILEFLWIPKSHRSVDRQKNSMKNFNSFDSRWVVETAVKMCEISDGEEIFWVWLKMADRDFQVFHPWILVTP